MCDSCRPKRAELPEPRVLRRPPTYPTVALAIVAARSERVVPDRRNFREAMRAITTGQDTRDAYLTLAALCVAAANLLEREAP